LLQDLVPFLVVGGVFLIAFFAFCHFVQKTRIISRVSEPSPVADLEDHVIALDVPPQRELDPQLASILVYPGAVPIRKSVAEREVDVRLDRQHSREVSITYWTPDPVETVWEHYRRELPDWAETMSQDAGRELLYQTDHHSCLIRVYTHEGRTLIDATVKPAQYNRNNLFSQN
jgi:hypothetical protein